ncbi:MAG: helix-turn-helix domain-containing protein [Candidatus Aenigmarchaeota archaeon]|nr:helix-turn-helix domain-containing protein [Candidatus Aenigmarchaeota archaeon]
MKPPCENVVKYVLPAVRALIARDLIETYKLTQKEAAKRLGMTQPAISQYKKHIRGEKINLLEGNKEINDSIAALSSSIAKREIDLDRATDELCKICKLIRKSKILDKLS